MLEVLEKTFLGCMYFVCVVIIVIMFICGLYFLNHIYKEIGMETIDPQKVECQLISRDVSFGKSETHLTIWHCEKYGYLTSTNDEVFRLGKEFSTLLIKHSTNETRIVGIAK